MRLVGTYSSVSTITLHSWRTVGVRGEEFSRLLRGAYQDEGDIVYVLRRGIDLLRQVRFACGEDEPLRDKLHECIERIDRDEVSIVL